MCGATNLAGPDIESLSDTIYFSDRGGPFNDLLIGHTLEIVVIDVEDGHLIVVGVGSGG